jgi:hypothetical protein
VEKVAAGLCCVLESASCCSERLLEVQNYMINITYQSSNTAVAKIVLADIRIRIGSSLTCPCSELCLGHQGVKRAAPFSMAEQALRNFLSHVESNCRVFLFDENAFPRMVCYNMQGSPSSAVLGLRLKRSTLASQCYFDCSEVARQASFIFHCNASCRG